MRSEDPDGGAMSVSSGEGPQAVSGLAAGTAVTFTRVFANPLKLKTQWAFRTVAGVLPDEVFDRVWHLSTL
jgi:hypothetical protein